MDMPDWKLESHSSYANVSHAVIAGYFLYDMLVMLLHPDLLDKGSLAHHVVGLIAFPGLMVCKLDSRRILSHLRAG
jgi:hypothetical protein